MCIYTYEQFTGLIHAEQRFVIDINVFQMAFVQNVLEATLFFLADHFLDLLLPPPCRPSLEVDKKHTKQYRGCRYSDSALEESISFVAIQFKRRLWNSIGLGVFFSLRYRGLRWRSGWLVGKKRNTTIGRVVIVDI